MKPLAIWLAGLLVAFGLFVGGYELLRDETQLYTLVVVDSSFEMGEVWDELPEVLDGLDNASGTDFALATEKELLHGWADELDHDLGRVTAYAPRDLTLLEASPPFPDVAEADRRVFVTNAEPAELEGLVGWEIVRVGS